MQNIRRVALPALFVVAGMGSAVQAQSPCENYMVREGDTLRLISERAFGNRDLAQALHRANRNEIGANPNVIERGMVLRINCPDGSLPPPATAAEIAAMMEALIAEEAAAQQGDVAVAGPVAEPEPVAEPQPAEVQVAAAEPEVQMPEPQEAEDTGPVISMASTLLVVGDERPFVGSGLPQGGMIPAIARAALSRSGYDLALASSRSSLNTVDALMQASSISGPVLAFPLLDPGCAGRDSLDPESLLFCDSLRFSVPLYEVVLTMFAAPGTRYAEAVSVAQLSEAMVCIPSMIPSGPLRRSGIADVIWIDWQGSTEECFEALRAGAVDMVFTDYLSAEAQLGLINTLDDIINNDSFSFIASVHAAAPRQNAAAVELLTYLDRGATALLQSGEWASIASEYLQ